MTSISPNTGSCCPPGSFDATGGGPVLDPALDAGPTGSAPVGVAPVGPNDLPPPPPTTGEIPGASAPTGYDSTPVDVAGGGPAYLPAPAPVDVAGVSGPGVVDPGSSTASVTGGGPEAVTPEGIIAGGGPGAAPVGSMPTPIPGVVPSAVGMSQPLPGWNANIGDAFAKAFDQAGVDPATASAALHSLAAMGASAEELDQTLAYLQTEDGASLAPYMAEELAGQAPSYARRDVDTSMLPSDVNGPGGQNTPPVDPTTGQPIGIDPTTGQPVGDASGEPTPVAQTEDGGTQMSDGSTHYEDGSIIQPDGTMVAPDGSTLSPDGTLTRADGTTAKIDMATGQEIDPKTGKPVDPNAAPADGAEGEPPTEGGMSNWAKFGIGAVAVAAVGGFAAWKMRSRAEAQPLPGLGGTDGPGTPRPNGGPTPDGPTPRTTGAPRSTSPAAERLRAQFRQNSGAGSTRTTPTPAPTTTPEPRTAAPTSAFERNFEARRAAILGGGDVPATPRTTPSTSATNAARSQVDELMFKHFGATNPRVAVALMEAPKDLANWTPADHARFAQAGGTSDDLARAMSPIDPSKAFWNARKTAGVGVQNLADGFGERLNAAKKVGSTAVKEAGERAAKQAGAEVAEKVGRHAATNAAKVVNLIK